MAITISGSGITSENIADGTIVDADVADVAASKLTGALPAISGANLTGLTSAQMPAGSVLQVKIVEDASQLLVASDTYTDTNLSIDITPLSTSSKILAMWNVQGNISAAGGGWGTQLLRGSTAVFTSSHLYVQYASTEIGQRVSADYKHLDSPNTTSPITYKVQVGTYQSRNCYFNDDNAQTQLVIMEISG